MALVPVNSPGGMAQSAGWDVRVEAARWGVSPEEAQVWGNAVQTQSYFVRGIWFYVPGGAFTALAVSTPSSNRAAATAWAQNASGMPVTHPEWMEYEVYLFQDLAIGNVSYN